MTNLPEANFSYVGSELELFAAVHNWKAYWSSHIRPFVGQEILEVGAGIGSNTPFLDASGQGRWLCLEPDPQLLRQLADDLGKRSRALPYETICGTLATLDAMRRFDTIIYIDVLEHIKDDRAELERAAAHLNSGGHVIVLAPAHRWLFTPFDQAVGHFRRYNRSMLRDISPSTLEIEQLHYLDSIGLAASLANRLFLRQSMPTKEQLRMWDSWMVPLSRVVDKLLRYSIGKSIVAIWRKP
ncbi:MAG: class I SAM-dependent methyltransferase [Bryobacteraceae bacterium]|nr:class I SAM-dependent methyltransferase [Bryobacteraceae bacterium]